MNSLLCFPGLTLPIQSQVNDKTHSLVNHSRRWSFWTQAFAADHSKWDFFSPSKVLGLLMIFESTARHESVSLTVVQCYQCEDCRTSALLHCDEPKWKVLCGELASSQTAKDWSLGLHNCDTAVRNDSSISLCGVGYNSIDQDRDRGSLHCQLPLVQ